MPKKLRDRKADIRTRMLRASGHVQRAFIILRDTDYELLSDNGYYDVVEHIKQDLCDVDDALERICAHKQRRREI